MPVVFHEAYEVDIGPHVFPTAKYRLVRERLLEEGVVREGDLHRPEPASDEAILLVHTERWMGKLKHGDLSPQEQLLLEVPYSRALCDAAWLCAGGSILTGRLALEHGVAVHLGGGFHHAFPDHGEGFCPLNDVAVAVRELERQGKIDRSLMIDCDVHHGNGTAAIFSEDAQVYTFSMHQQHNYPMHKPPGDMDLGLVDWTADHEYLRLLEQHLPSIVRTHRPDLAFYLAGADPYREDQLGGLALSIDGLRRRDELVLGMLGEANVPVGVCLAGGYALHTDDTVAIHCGTVAAAGVAGERYWSAL
jgi:acetoin utilization deacetylase AcuC-like enzyme